MKNNQEREINQKARDLLNQLSALLRTSQIHDTANEAVISGTDRLVSVVNDLIVSQGSVGLKLRGEYFYLNDSRIRYTLEHLLNFDFLTREFKKRELGSVIFSSSVGHEDIKRFIAAFISSSFSQEPFDSIEKKMSEVQSVAVEKLMKIVETESLDTRKMVRKTYSNAVTYTGDIIRKIRAGEKVSLKTAKRIVASMVDQIVEEEELLLGMAAIKNYDEYTYQHSVNVSILSMALGQRLGLNRKMLTDLGMMALFHDIGKINVPNEILNKPASFDEEEWKIIRKHPFWGAKALLNLRKIDEFSVKSAIIAFEHHLNFDLSGYPKIRSRFELDFFSRIISVADWYDAITSARVYTRNPLPPDRALSVMLENSGTRLDPLILKFFINMVGIFPIGTIVMLNTNELGFVSGTNQLFLKRPKITVIIDRDGYRIDGRVVDLTEKDEKGEYIRTIIKTVNSARYKMTIARYLQ
ncbi:MAG: HD-GYP domain-containing protein [Desulfobacteraceae bacterium]|nr:MAG: HD-GYP domain-containing protein [Desulfobacteraceae bacterium]